MKRLAPINPHKTLGKIIYFCESLLQQKQSEFNQEQKEVIFQCDSLLSRIKRDFPEETSNNNE